MKENSELKSYLTGLIASFPGKTVDIKKINSNFKKDIHHFGYHNENGGLDISDAHKYKFSLLNNDIDKLVYIRAFYDTSSYLNQSCNNIKIIFIIKQEDIKDNILSCLVKHCHVIDHQNGLEIRGSNVIDFLEIIYNNAIYYNTKKFNQYQKIVYGSRGVVRNFKWSRSLPGAVPPKKHRTSDSGYDLTLIKLEKIVGNVNFYNTGIRLEPPPGFYFDVVPRSSISKSGYMIANSVGVIDSSYTGDVLIALIKTDPNAKDLELPSRLVQIIPRPILHLNPVEVEELNVTERGASGWGSSDVKK